MGGPAIQEEEDLAALGGFRNGCFFAMVEAIPGRVSRDDRALECCQCAGDVGDGIRIGLLRECAREQPRIRGIGTQNSEEFRGAQSEFHGEHSEHRFERLFFERMDTRVAPVELPIVGHVDQAHRAARVKLARSRPCACARPSVKARSCRWHVAQDVEWFTDIRRS